MLTFLLRRIVYSVPVVIGVTVVVFAMMHIAPGDPAQAMLGPMATPENLELIRHELGSGPAALRSIPDLGQPRDAWRSRRVDPDVGAVREQVIDRFGASLLLGGASFVIAVIVGIAAGVVSALRPGKNPDRLIMLTA